MENQEGWLMLGDGGDTGDISVKCGGDSGV